MTTVSPGVGELRLEITPGEGIVLRRAGVVLVIPDVSRGEEAAQRLIELCTEASPVTPATLLRRIAYALGDPTADSLVGGCVLVGLGTGSLRMLAFGDVEVVLGDGDVIAAKEYLTWVERSLSDAAGFTVLAAGRRWGGDLVGGRWFDLRDGIVPGGGIRLAADPPGGPATHDSRGGRDDAPEPGQHQPERRSAAPDPATTAPPASSRPPEAVGTAPSEPSRRSVQRPAPSAGPETPTAEHPVMELADEPFESVLLHDATEGSVGDPLPVAGEVVGSPDGVFVQGVVCSRGHFNDPGSGYCAVCGISMVQRTQEFVSAPRPALGVLIFDNGAVFSVDGDYVVGREPDLDPEVVSGRARPLTLNDEANAVSRVHAALRLDGWRTLLQDRGSANGTFVAEPGAPEDWMRLEHGASLDLRSGQHVRFGQRVAVFESHVRRR